MAVTRYDKTIGVIPNLLQLTAEIDNDATIAPKTVASTEGVTCADEGPPPFPISIWMSDALTAGEETALDDVLAAHVPKAILSEIAWDVSGYSRANSSTAPGRVGHWLNGALQFDTAGSGDDTGGSYHRQTTAAVPNDSAYLQSANMGRFDQNPVHLAKFALPSIADVRFTLGFVNAGGGALFGSDDPAGDYAALSFSKSVGRDDVNFQFMTKDGTTQKLYDSGVVATTDPYWVRVDVRKDIGCVVFSLLDNNFKELVSLAAMGNLPRDAQTNIGLHGVETLVAGTKDHFIYMGKTGLRR